MGEIRGFFYGAVRSCFGLIPVYFRIQDDLFARSLGGSILDETQAIMERVHSDGHSDAEMYQITPQWGKWKGYLSRQGLIELNDDHPRLSDRGERSITIHRFLNRALAEKKSRKTNGSAVSYHN